MFLLAMAFDWKYNNQMKVGSFYHFTPKFATTKKLQQKIPQSIFFQGKLTLRKELKSIKKLLNQEKKVFIRIYIHILSTILSIRIKKKIKLLKNAKNHKNKTNK